MKFDIFPSSFHSIIVPTIDTVRNDWIIHKLIKFRCHVMTTGETGTGKSVAVKRMMLEDLSPDRYRPLFLTYSAQTTAFQTQGIIDNKLDKRRRGVFGPPIGKICIIFVDDLNMPMPEVYGAQPPIELIRQHMGQGGWYDRKALEYRAIIDCTYIGSMGPPGGGRNPMSERAKRKFNIISYVEMDDTSKAMIFETILSSYLMDKFQDEVKGTVSELVLGAIDLYNAVLKQMLPTPAKSHYTFNLRDLSKVFQGVCSGSPDRLKAVSYTHLTLPTNREV